MKPLEYLVDVKNLEIVRSGKIVLKDINFQLSEGEFAYISGPTGSGKSSFLNVLYGTLPANRGSIRVLDSEVTLLSRSQMPFYRRKLGMIFQEDMLVDQWTVVENLELILSAQGWKEPAKRRDRIEVVLERLGLDTLRNNHVGRLSGGERQLTTLAQSVLNLPRILLADEPTGNLDEQSSTRFMKELISMARQNKMSVIVATHNEQLVRRFPARRYLCQDERLVEMSLEISFNR